MANSIFYSLARAHCVRLSLSEKEAWGYIPSLVCPTALAKWEDLYSLREKQLPVQLELLMSFMQWLTVTVSDCSTSSSGAGLVSGPGGGGESCVLQGKIATRKK